MNQKKDYSNFFGEVTILGKKYTYKFENETLFISMPPTIEAVQFHSRLEDLPVDQISGTIGDDTKSVLFLVDKKIIGYKFSSAINSSLIVIRLHVFSLLICESDYLLDVDHYKITVSNPKFAKWLQLFPIYKEEQKIAKEKFNGWNFKLECGCSSIRESSQFTFKSKHISMRPGARCDHSLTKITFTPSLDSEVKGKFDISFVNQYLLTLFNLLQFAFYRTSVELGDVTISVSSFEKNVGLISHKVGELYWFSGYQKAVMQESKITKLTEHWYIPWTYLYRHVGTLMTLLDNEEINTFSLPETRLERDSISFSSIPKHAASFDFSFSKYFANFKSPKLKEKSRLLLKTSLEKLKKDTSLDKNLINNLQNSLFYPTLREKVDCSLKRFYPLMKKYYKILLQVQPSSDLIAQVSKEFVDARNAVDHGHLKYNLNPIIASSFALIKILVLIMDLKRIGFNNVEIQNTIPLVFELR